MLINKIKKWFFKIHVIPFSESSTVFFFKLSSWFISESELESKDTELLLKSSADASVCLVVGSLIKKIFRNNRN